MSFLGLSADDYVEENTAWVWPCNVPAVNLFVALGTQWRVGPGGAYGLDYTALYQKLDRLGLSAEEAERMEEDIRILEDAALEQMRKDQE
jgi:hypothetical protein